MLRVAYLSGNFKRCLEEFEATDDSSLTEFSPLLTHCVDNLKQELFNTMGQ